MSTKKKNPKSAEKPSFQIVDPKTFKAAPRKLRTSAYDPIAKDLASAAKGKVAIVSVPEGANPQRYRSYAYAAMQKSLQRVKPGKYAVSIRIGEDKKTIGISLK